LDLLPAKTRTEGKRSAPSLFDPTAPRARREPEADNHAAEARRTHGRAPLGQEDVAAVPLGCAAITFFAARASGEPGVVKRGNAAQPAGKNLVSQRRAASSNSRCQQSRRQV
jgi:hypothetical protein